MTRQAILSSIVLVWGCSEGSEAAPGESAANLPDAPQVEASEESGGAPGQGAGEGGSPSAPVSTGGADPSSEPQLEPGCDVFAGPDGSHWPPSTPVYTTPATQRIESLSELNYALQSAESGDVIEVAPGTLEESLTITAGQATWEENVLVRPLLGHRGEVEIAAGVTITSAHVTLAGFTISTSVVMREGADRSFLARGVLSKNAVVIANDTVDSGWYELVATEAREGADRSQVKASAGNTSDGFVAAGLWFKGAYREVGSSDHSDTLQLVGISGGTVRDVTLLDSVLFPSANAALQIGETTGTRVVGSWLAPCGGFSEDVPEEFECGGYHAMQGGEDNEVHGSIVNGVLKGAHPYSSVTESHIAGFALDPIQESDNTIDPDIRVEAPQLCDLEEIWDQ